MNDVIVSSATLNHGHHLVILHQESRNIKYIIRYPGAIRRNEVEYCNCAKLRKYARVRIMRQIYIRVYAYRHMSVLYA